MNNKHNDPGIPASKAWQQMKDLLDVEMPAGNGGKQRNNRKYTLLLLILLAGGCGIYKLYNYTVEKESRLSYNNTGKPPINNSSQREMKLPGKNILIKENENKTSIPGKITTQIAVGNESLPLNKPGRTSGNTTFRKPAGTGAAANILPKSKTDNNHERASDKESNLKINVPGVAISQRQTNKDEPAKDIVSNNKNSIQNKTTNPADENKNTTPKSIVKNSGGNTNKEINAVDSVRQTVTVPGVSAKKSPVKKIANKHYLPFHFGLEWNVTLPFGNNTVFREVNAKNQPLISLIPTLWGSKDLTNKSTIILSFNPYTQYLLNKTATVMSGNYLVGATSASAINQPPAPVSLAQTFSLYKVMGVEATLQYAYRLSGKWSAGAALGYTWATTALFNEKLVRNKTDVLKDSLYGAIRTDEDWKFINPHFVTGKLNVAYHFKHYQLGATMSRPFTSVYKKTTEGNLPVNMQVFLRWVIR